MRPSALASGFLTLGSGVYLRVGVSPSNVRRHLLRRDTLCRPSPTQLVPGGTLGLARGSVKLSVDPAVLCVCNGQDY